MLLHCDKFTNHSQRQKLIFQKFLYGPAFPRQSYLHGVKPLKTHD
jgi:hypothetical protein